jgi:hypothetical protein
MTREVTAEPIGAWHALVEREVEREAITSALADCALGRGRVVLVYGPSGAGRSSLVHAAVAEAATRDIAVLEAGGSELERGYGFGILRQLLEARIARLSAAQRRAMLADAGPAAAAALGSGQAVPRGSSATFEQNEGVYRLVSGLAVAAPLLLAVDDLQWCDRPSLDFLCFLGHRVRRLPVCIVASWRRGEPGVRAGGLQALASSRDTVFLAPGPLTLDGVRVVSCTDVEPDADEESVEAIHAQTGGQPFLVSELVAGLRLRGVTAQAGMRQAIEGVTPESVRRNVAARLGRHPEPVLRFAQAAAVLGETGLAQAAALAAIDADKARRPADALVRSGILRDDAVIGFAEPLMRAAVYDTLSSLECAALHQRAAELLLEAAPEADAADEARIAEHLLRSEPAGQLRFRAVLHAVAGERTRAGAYADARRLLERALGESDDELRGETLTQLADTELRLGCFGAALAHASEALVLRLAPSTRHTACVVAAQSLALTAGTQAALAMLAAERERDGEPSLGLRAAAATLRACAGEPGDPAEAEITAKLRGATADERRLLALCAADHVLGATASARDIRELCVRALDVNVGADATACYFAGFAALRADAGELVESLLEGNSLDAEQTADAALVRLALGAQLAFDRGELERARRAALGVLEHVAAAPDSALGRRVRTDTLAVLVLAALECARGEDARDALSELSEQENADASAVASLRVAVALSEDRLDDAIDAARALEASSAGREWAALAWHAAGDCDAAVAHAAAHLDHVRLCGGASVLGSALTVRGVVTAGKEQVEHLEAAVALLENTSASLALARATIELGSALRRAGRRRDARERLIEAADLAYRCGAAALSAGSRDIQRR